MFGFKKRRREKIRRRPFPPVWREIIEKNIPYFQYLSLADQKELLGDVQVFLAEKHFEGCGGLKVTDEIRVTIAAQACILLLHRENDDYPGLESILVYPHPYRAVGKRSTPEGFIEENRQVRGGESFSRGAVVLAWDEVKRGAADIRDGHNVVFHEFAHQLDQQSGNADGTPVLGQRSAYPVWARVLGGEYDRLIRDIHRNRPTDIDPYGAVSPAEFFAVATEYFFEKSRLLQTRHPELYRQLQEFYRQDPASSYR